MTSTPNEVGATDPEVVSYPLEKQPSELQFGDIIELPLDSSMRESGRTMALESWTREDETVYANGVLFSDKPKIGGTASFQLPLSVVVTGRASIDILVEYYLGNPAMVLSGKTKIEEALREMQNSFKVD